MAVAGALTDAATQGIAIAFGDQHGFSFKEMIENSAAAGFTAGVSKYFNVGKLLHDAKYAQVFATEVGIGITVQLFQIEMGLRQNIDPALIFEQAAGTIASAKINSEKMMKGLPNVVQHGADELANTAIGAAVGQKVDFMTAAANVVGDEAADGAEMLAKHKQHNLSPHQDKEEDNQGVAPNAPQTYVKHANSTHADHHFNPGSSEKDDFTDFLDDAYDAQHQAIAESLSDSSEARIHEADEMERHGDLEAHGHNTTVSTKSWEQGLAEEVYAHQDSILAKGLMALCTAIDSTTNSMHATAEFLDKANPIAAMQEADTGRDPITNHPVTTLQAYEHFAFSIPNIIVGEVELGASIAKTATSRFIAPTISRAAEATAPLRTAVSETVVNTGSKIGRGVDFMTSKVVRLFKPSGAVTLSFKSKADPLLETLGDARISHPDEYRAIMDDLKHHGVNIAQSGDNRIAFSPGLKGGPEGNSIHLPNEFSISALRHEYGHFLDHKALGFPRYIDYFKSPELIVNTERSQYLSEIRLSRQIGDRAARRTLIENYLAERNGIVDKYYQRTYGKMSSCNSTLNGGY